MNQNIYVVIEHLRGQVADISYVMLAAARHVTDATQGQLVAVLLGHNADHLADDLAADRILYFDDPALADFTPDAYKATLINLLRDDNPRAVFMGDTSIGAEVAGGLSIQLNLPLVSHCRQIEAENGSLKFVSQLCGGKIMAEGNLPDETVLVLMVPGAYKVEAGQSTDSPPITACSVPPLEQACVTFKHYIEPTVEDVDISKEAILIAVGRGIQGESNMELAQELAEALGGVVCGLDPN